MADADLRLSHTSDGLHNENCYHYLNHLVLSEGVFAEIKKHHPLLHDSLLRLKSESYNKTLAYGDLYHQFFKKIERNIEEYQPGSLAFRFDQLVSQYKDPAQVMSKQEEDLLQELTDFFFSIYANNAKILESTFNAIKNIPLSHAPEMPKIQQSISRYISNDKKINKKTHSPLEIGRPLRRLLTLFKGNYKPQHSTNLASVRTYEYMDHLPEDAPFLPKEYRFGTQGQFHKGIARISPLFKQWLKVLAFKRAMNPDPEKHPTPITHIYINNLGRDRSDYAGLKESQLTHKLHELENTHPNLCVITLPAEKGLMHITDYKRINDGQPAAKAYEEFLEIVLAQETTDPVQTLASAQATDGDDQRIRDFHISPRIRELLFADHSGYSKTVEKQRIESLLQRSFHAFGLETTGIITPAQKQAVWFHFLKFELTNYIFDTLKPESVNFTCKDAIDRGGVSSAYYNLLRSLDAHYPLSREEFERALHAAPTLVKGRGLNHHLNLIWNVIDVYLDNPANYDQILSDPKAEWLIEWRDLNCPNKRVASLLSKRLQQARKEIEIALEETDSAEEAKLFLHGRDIIDNIIKQQNLNLNIDLKDKRLFLETVTRTLNILFRPNTTHLTRYTEIIGKLMSHSCFNFLKKTMYFILQSIMSTIGSPQRSCYREYVESLAMKRQAAQGMQLLKLQREQILNQNDEVPVYSPKLSQRSCYSSLR